ncbi:MAG TPA: ATP-binding protein [Alphaproteobacteria bacterium]|nr:ATP-binding protein [Alphaproteobacteria bacterium]
MPGIGERLRIVQAVDLVKMTPLLIIGNLIAVALTVIIAHGLYFANYLYLLPILVLVALLVPSGLVWLRLRHKPRPDRVSPRHIRRITVHSLLMGLSWAAIFGSIFPVLTPFEALTTLLVGGFLGMGSVGAIASMPAACIAYFAPYWGTLLVVSLLFAQSTGIWVVLNAAGVLVFAIALNSSYRRIVDNEKVLADNERMLRQQHEAERAEQAALVQAQRNLIAALPFPVVVTQGNSVFEASPAARRQFGVEDDDLSRLSISDFFADPKDREALIEAQQRDGLLDDVEVRFQDSKGRQFWGTCTTRRLIYMDAPSWLISVYVIDERKRMEQELASAKEQAEAALAELQAAQASLLHSEKMASLGKLTAGVAHEIKNPLNFINNFSKVSIELMQDLLAALAPARGGLDEGQRAELDELAGMLTDNLKRIDEHGQRADRIVKGMLMHSRGGSAEMLPTNLNLLIDDALNLAYHGAKATDHDVNVAIERHLDSEVGTVTVAPQDLTRVLVNLINNGFYAARQRAVAEGEAFRPLLSVSSRRLADGVELRVRDNGTGIPPAVRKQMFTPFFTTKPAGEGSGLGLSISYDIVVQQHGGRFEVESEENAFTEFVIYLPDRTAPARHVDRA